MSTYAISFYDEPDCLELVDIAWFDSFACMVEGLQALGVHHVEHAGERDTTDGGSIAWGAWPCGEETDYDVYCDHCFDHMWHGLNCDCDEGLSTQGAQDR